MKNYVSIKKNLPNIYIDIVSASESEEQEIHLDTNVMPFIFDNFLLFKVKKMSFTANIPTNKRLSYLRIH